MSAGAAVLLVALVLSVALNALLLVVVRDLVCDHQKEKRDLAQTIKLLVRKGDLARLEKLIAEVEAE